MTAARWGLLSAPALLLAGLGGGPLGAAAALAAWMGAGWLRGRRRPVLYPRQRAHPLWRPALFWAAASLGLRALPIAVPAFGRFPAWAGTVFFSLALSAFLSRLRLRRKAARALTALLTLLWALSALYLR